MGFDLTEPEQQLVAAVESANPCDFGTTTAGGTTRGEHERTIRAAVLVALLRQRTGPDSDQPVSVVVREAVITGDLRMDGAVVDIATSKCRFNGDVSFMGSTFVSAFPFASASFVGDTWFSKARFVGDAPFAQATFHRTARFGRATFTEGAGFTGAKFFGEVQFHETTFSGTAWFSEVRFHGDAWFDNARFNGDAWFHRATFAADAWFNGATFTADGRFGNALFVGASWFSGVAFDGATTFSAATFAKSAWFGKATFAGDVVFSNAVAWTWMLAATRFATDFVGPLIAVKSVDLQRAVFTTRVRIEIVGEFARAGQLRAFEGAHLVVRANSVYLDDADFGPGSILEPGPGLHSTPDPNEIGWAARFVAGDPSLLRGFLVHELATTVPDGCRLVSLQRAMVNDLSLSNIDLSECRFQGTHNLDKMRMSSTSTFARTPRLWPAAIPAWVQVRRRVVAEEIAWRTAHPARRWADASASSSISAHDVAALYRELRKGLEDNKNNPDAADFYYGEMEMRRLAGREQGGLFSISAERALLHVYWAIAGYGLRAWRAAASLMSVVLVAAMLFSWAGFMRTAPEARIVSMDSSGMFRYDVPPSQRIGFWQGLELATRESLSLLQARSLPVGLTGAGTVLDIALRIVGPALLAFIVLALRNRTKR